MTPDITVHEVFRLARTMSLKNALADIPFGGAKAGIKWAGGSEELKKDFIQNFARAIKPFVPEKYIAGPDVNTGQKEMQWFVEETGVWESATGKPENFCNKKGENNRCGIPHEAGSTGFGVAEAAKVATEILGINIKNSTVAIHGFGNVGTFAYKFLSGMGANIVAIADKNCAIFSPDGFNSDKIEKIIKERKDLCQYDGKAKKISAEDFWKIPVDILIPASVTDVINEDNKDSIRAKIIVEGANIPMQENIEEELVKKGSLIVPDFVANMGGVVSSYAEYAGYQLNEMFNMVESRIKNITRLVLTESVKSGVNPRLVALKIAESRIKGII